MVAEVTHRARQHKTDSVSLVLAAKAKDEWAMTIETMRKEYDKRREGNAPPSQIGWPTRMETETQIKGASA